jgi:hypothetical protein
MLIAFLTPALATVFAVLAMLAALPWMQARFEAPYTPEHDPGTWAVDLENELTIDESWTDIHALAMRGDAFERAWARFHAPKVPRTVRVALACATTLPCVYTPLAA